MRVLRQRRVRPQTINFYNINEEIVSGGPAGIWVCEGLGAARKKKWGQMMASASSASVQAADVQCFLLIDIRHAPSANDKMMYDWILSQGYHPIHYCDKA